MFALYAFFACIVCSLLALNHRKKLAKAKSHPPGPARLPLIGNLHQITNPLHICLQNLARKHGDLMFLLLGSVPTIVVSSGEMVKEIFKSHDLVFSGRPGSYAGRKMFYGLSSMTFSPYGEYWRGIRKIAILELLSVKRVQSFKPVRDEEVSLMLDSIASSSGPIDLSDLMIVLSNNVVCQCVFGKKYNGGHNGKRVDDILREQEELVAGVCVADYFPWMGWINKFNGLEQRVDKCFRDLDSLYEKAIEEHTQDASRPKTKHEDVIDVLLRIQKDPNQEIALTNNSIKGIISDLLAAGTDSSASVLFWIMTELMRNPLVMRKAQDEVRGVVQGEGPVRETDLSRLEYLKLVVKESLRIHPPAPLLVPRETTDDCEIKGYKIAAKTRVFVNAKAIFQDPNSWQNPSEFRPERFQENSNIDFRGQSFEFIPFGVGRRGCPAVNFAIQVVEIVLANLLHRFDWELPHGMTGEDLDMEETPGIAVHRKTPLCLVARRK